MIFWYTWFKLTFNNIYARLAKWLHKFVCFKKAKQGIKGENEEISNGIEGGPVDAQQIDDEELSYSKGKQNVKKGDKKIRDKKVS